MFQETLSIKSKKKRINNHGADKMDREGKITPSVSTWMKSEHFQITFLIINFIIDSKSALRVQSCNILL